VIQLVIIGIYLSLLLLLGVLASRMFTGTKKDYMQASNSIGPFLMLMSLFGTTMTAFALVGSSGEAFKEGIGVYGMLASSSGIIHSLCFFILGIKLWSYGTRFGYSTQIQFFRDRLDNDAIGLLLFPILVGLVIPYLLVGVISAGTVMQSMTAGAFEDFGWFETTSKATSFGLPPYIGAAVICIVVLIYVFFGGMRGTAWANAFQTIVFMILGVVTFYVIAMKLGGQEGFWESLRTASEAVGENKATRSEMSQSKFFTYLLVPLSVGMFPHLFQHWLTAKSASSFKLPIIAHPLFIMIVWVPCVLIGIWATTSLVPAVPPLPKTPTGAVNANAVLAFLVKTLTNPYLGGLLTAGILAAIMSSLDSQFLCIGSIFENDVVTHYMGKDRFNDRQQILITRGFIIAIVAVTYGLSLINPTSVFTLGIWCFSGFSSLFPLVFASLYWRRLTAPGAYACVIAAIVSWIYLFAQSNFGKNRDYTLDLVLGGVTYETMPVLTMFICSTVALVVVSLVTKPPREEVLEKFFPTKS
jgi:SSS family solute:Na+ symporter